MTVLFSEEKERSRRFKLSLKMAFPLVLVILLLLGLMFTRDDFLYSRSYFINYFGGLLCLLHSLFYLFYAFRTTIIRPGSGVLLEKR